MEATVEEVEATRGVMEATIEEVEATGGLMVATVEEVEATGGVMEATVEEGRWRLLLRSWRNCYCHWRTRRDPQEGDGGYC